MSAVSKRKQTTVQHEYFMPSPACWTDVQKAFDWAANDRTAAGLSNDWDDVIKVEARDAEIVVYWVED